MNRLQTVALWVGTVALAVIAVFSTIDYFETDTKAEAHRAAEVAHWERLEGLACISALFDTTSVGSNAAEDAIAWLEGEPYGCFQGEE